MIKKLIGTLTIVSLFAANANANHSVTITGPADVPGYSCFQLLITGDFFGQGLISGGIQVLWDSTLVELDDITLDLPIDPDLSCPGAGLCPDDAPGVASIVWGQFLTNLIETDDPPTLMATMTFSADLVLEEETAYFDIVDFSSFTGGWFGAGFTTIPPPELIGFSVDINPGQCTGGGIDNATFGTSVVSDLTCAALVSIDVQGATMVFGPDGHLHLTAPSTRFQSGFKVLEGGSLTATSAHPSMACSP